MAVPLLFSTTLPSPRTVRAAAHLQSVRLATWLFFTRSKRKQADLELPLVRRRNPPVKAYWNQARILTKAAAWKKVARLEIGKTASTDTSATTVRDAITRCQLERMPTRHSTARVYRSFFQNHILPKWGDTPIRNVQPRPVELWLRELPLSPKSKTHVRSLTHALMEFSMWAGLLETSRNPISLVQNKGATRKVCKARSLTVEEFRALLEQLNEPFGTMALLCVLGLRISEALAFRWEDVDWLGERLSIRRASLHARR